MTEAEMLQNAGTIEKYTLGQPVFSQHDSGEEMYVVLKGTFGVFIDTFTGFTSRVAGITQGSFFGEMAVIDGSPRSASIVSEENGSVVVKISRDNFHLLLENAPNMTNAIINTLKKRAATTADALRAAGKEPPMLPPVSAVVDSSKANMVLEDLSTLAACVRRMNNLLAGDPAKSFAMEEEFLEAFGLDESEDFEEKLEKELEAGTVDFEPDDRIKLLPEGYQKYGTTDLKLNTDSFREVKVVCPYCYKAIKTYSPIHGRLGSMQESLDGRVVYSNLNILLYTNTICPNCGYCDTNMEFSVPRSAQDPPKFAENQFENVEEFTHFDRILNRSIDEAILSYYLNLECLKRTSNDPLRYANAWIRLYWLFSDQGSMDYAKEAAKHARHYYTKYAGHGTRVTSVDDKMKLNAILAELSIVLGDYSRASEEYKANLVIGKGSKNPLLKESSKRIDDIKKME